MRVVHETCVLKLSIFVVQKLALHQNGVQFRQQSIGDIRGSVATLYDLFLLHMHNVEYYNYTQLQCTIHAQFLEERINTSMQK